MTVFLFRKKIVCLNHSDIISGITEIKYGSILLTVIPYMHFCLDECLFILLRQLTHYLLETKITLVGFTPVVKVYLNEPSSPKQYILPLFS